MPTLPNTVLRQKLSWLGIPETQHSFESLVSMFPTIDPKITDVNSAAEVLIYLITKNIIQIPSVSADALVKEIKYGGHICQFYRKSDDLLALLVPFFKQGVERNHRGIWIVSNPLTMEVAEAALKAAGMGSALERGVIQIYPAETWYARPDGAVKGNAEIMKSWSDTEKKALDEGFSGLRITGDTRFVVTERDWKSLMEYEAQVHGVFDNSRIMAICTYAFGRFESSAKTILGSHDEVVVNSGRYWHRMNTKVEEAELALSAVDSRR